MNRDEKKKENFKKSTHSSDFASRMAEKQKERDHRLSNMKSKLSDLNLKKERTAKKDNNMSGTKTVDRTLESNSTVFDSNAQINKINDNNIKESSLQAKNKIKTDDSLIKKNITGNQMLMNKTVDENNSKSAKDKTNIAPDKVAKSLSEKKYPKANSGLSESLQIINKPKSSGVKGMPGLGGKSDNQLKPSKLLKKITDRLDTSGDLKFVSEYRDLFVRQLKSLHNSYPTIAWYTNKFPQILSEQSGIVQLSYGKSKLQMTGINPALNLNRYMTTDSIGSVLVILWEDLFSISPNISGQIRQHTDIHVIQSLPSSNMGLNLVPLLERVSRNSGSLIIAPLNLKEEIQSLQFGFEINRNYSVIDEERITYVNNDISSNDFSWLQELFADKDKSTVIKDFSSHRGILRVANMLEKACDKELQRLELVSGLSNPKGGTNEKEFSVEELDALIKSTQASTKSLLSAKGIQVDGFGNINFVEKLNEAETAQAIVADLSIENLVREDELDILNFSNEQRKSINRIKRFRFASKLGFIWKLDPKYIEQLHRATSDVITKYVRSIHGQTTEIIDKHIDQMSTQINKLPPASPVQSSFQRFRSSWQTDQQIVKAISNYSDLNHFRSAIFSKRGSAAPLEAQRGVIKELRESRMFVSQLMAFGMLGAVLLGSTYAIDVFIGWFTGSAMNVGEELIQAAKDSRGLGRTVRILIAGVAGVCIVFYLALRIYLRNSEKILDQQRIVGVYAQQLEDVVSAFIKEASTLAKDIINTDIDRLIFQYESFRNSVSDNVQNSRVTRNDMDDLKTSPHSRVGSMKRIEDLKKWLNGLVAERDSFSIIQTQRSALGAAQERFDS